MLSHHGHRRPEYKHVPPIKSLTVTPPGGMGNRLMAIYGTIACYFIEKYDRLTIYWAKNNHCPISLHNIIKINGVEHRIIETSNYILNFPGLTKKSTQFFGAGCIYELVPNVSESPPAETILQWIIENIAKYIEYVPHQPVAIATYGIHCRRSDWGATTINNYDMTENLSQKRMILDIEFEKFIKPIITNQTAFLSTDSIRTEDYLKLCHPHIITTKKARYPTSTNRDEDLMREALVDLHTLAASQTIIRDSDSTFSYIAALMNGGFSRPNRLITWPRPVLQAAGPGFGF